MILQLVWHCIQCNCCSMSMYDAQFDEEAAQSSVPAFALGLDQKQSTKSDKDSAATGSDANGNDSPAIAHETPQPEDDAKEEATVSKFSYMNAADVAVALKSESGDGSGVTRVESVHSDEQETDADHSCDTVESTDARNDPSSSPARPDVAVPVPEMQDSTSDVIPPVPAIVIDDSPSDVVQDQTADSEMKSDDVSQETGGSPQSGLEPQSNTVAAENVAEAEPDSAAVDTSPAAQSDEKPATEEQASPPRKVTMRRLSRQAPQIAAPATPVVEVHINVDFTPTVFPDLELDGLSSEAGSAVQKLKLFLEDEKASSRSSAYHIPTAIQPGKAFDSLRYFLSTLD